MSDDDAPRRRPWPIRFDVPDQVAFDMAFRLADEIEVLRERHHSSPTGLSAALAALGRHADLLKGWDVLTERYRARFLISAAWNAREDSLPRVEPAANALAIQLQARARSVAGTTNVYGNWWAEGLGISVPDATTAITAAVILGAGTPPAAPSRPTSSATGPQQLPATPANAEGDGQDEVAARYALNRAFRAADLPLALDRGPRKGQAATVYFALDEHSRAQDLAGILPAPSPTAINEFEQRLLREHGITAIVTHNLDDAHPTITLGLRQTGDVLALADLVLSRLPEAAAAAHELACALESADVRGVRPRAADGRVSLGRVCAEEAFLLGDLLRQAAGLPDPEGIDVSALDDEEHLKELADWVREGVAATTGAHLSADEERHCVCCVHTAGLVLGTVSPEHARKLARALVPDQPPSPALPGLPPLRHRHR